MLSLPRRGIHGPEDVDGSITRPAVRKNQYGYDATGNRTCARIEQKGHTDRSYFYGYDHLNHLKFAERGVLNGTNDGIVDGGTGRAWRLDLLGNWSGGPSDSESVNDYSTVAGRTGNSATHQPAPSQA